MILFSITLSEFKCYSFCSIAFRRLRSVIEHDLKIIFWGFRVFGSLYFSCNKLFGKLLDSHKKLNDFLKDNVIGT